MALAWSEIAVKLQVLWRASCGAAGAPPLYVLPAFDPDAVVDEQDHESSASESEGEAPPVTAVVVPLAPQLEPPSARVFRIVARWWLQGRAQEAGRLLWLERSQREQARRGIEFWRMRLEEEDALEAAEAAELANMEALIEERRPGTAASQTSLQGWQQRRQALREASYDFEPYVIGRRRWRLAAAELAGVNDDEVRRRRAAMAHWEEVAARLAEQRRKWRGQAAAWTELEAARERWIYEKARVARAEAATMNALETALLAEGVQAIKPLVGSLQAVATCLAWPATIAVTLSDHVSICFRCEVQKRRRLRGKQPPPL